MTGREPILITDESILIKTASKDQMLVMHSAETLLMKTFADFVTQNGGHILEIGFGMHISADYIQANPNVLSHTIIEVHPIQYERALEWADGKKNVNIILGDWVDILPLDNIKFDGILHDTHMENNMNRFLESIKPNCIDGTVVAIFSMYNHIDHRVGVTTHKLSDIEIAELEAAYSPSAMKFWNSSSEYEFYYTKFNGTDFYKDKNIKGLI
jgi:hypothetical protein